MVNVLRYRLAMKGRDIPGGRPGGFSDETEYTTDVRRGDLERFPAWMIETWSVEGPAVGAKMPLAPGVRGG